MGERRTRAGHQRRSGVARSSVSHAVRFSASGLAGGTSSGRADGPIRAHPAVVRTEPRPDGASLRVSFEPRGLGQRCTGAFLALCRSEFPNLAAPEEKAARFFPPLTLFLRVSRHGSIPWMAAFGPTGGRFLCWLCAEIRPVGRFQRGGHGADRATTGERRRADF